jgi:hypothetical protein
MLGIIDNATVRPPLPPLNDDESRRIAIAMAAAGLM